LFYSITPEVDKFFLMPILSDRSPYVSFKTGHDSTFSYRHIHKQTSSNKVGGGNQKEKQQELSYRKQIARQLHKHYNNNTMTLKSGLEVTQCH